MDVFLNFTDKELLSMCRWDVAKSFIIACSDVSTFYVTYNVLKSALSVSPQQKETQPENVSTMLSMLFSGGYNSTAADVASSNKTSSKKEGFSNIELRGFPDFAIGEEVRVNIVKKRAWFQGHVVSANHESGLYSVTIQDGEKEINVKASRIRSSSNSSYSTSSNYAERVPSALRSIRYALSLLHEPFSFLLNERTKDRKLLDTEEILTSISDILEPTLSERLRTDKEVRKAFQKSLFESFGVATGKIDRKQFLLSLECKPQRFDRCVLTDFNVLRSCLWSIPYMALRREVRSNPSRVVYLVKSYSSRFLSQSMQGLRCVEMFLTKPVVEFRSIFENVVKTYQINTKIVGQIVRLLIKCRDDIKSDNMDESIAAWERFYADDVDTEKKTNTSRLFDALLHSSLSSYLKKKSKPSMKPSQTVSSKEQVRHEQRMMKLVGFFRDFYGRYNKSNVPLASQFAKKWIGNEKTLKMALIKKYSQSRTQWDWSVLDSISS